MAAAWVRQVVAGFAVVADPDLSLISAFGANSSVYMTADGPGGRIVKTYPADSAETLRALGATVDRLGAVTSRDIPLDDAPKKLVSGCPFERRRWKKG